MPKSILLSLSLLSATAMALDVPVDDLEPWTLLSFDNIKPNEVTIGDDALLVSVRGSASPLIYQFDEPIHISGVTVTASWNGVNRINFLSTTQRQERLGESRTHPLNDLLHETRILYLDAPGPFVMTHEFPAPVEALGLWVSVDGDNTGSNFDLRLEHITLRTR